MSVKGEHRHKNSSEHRRRAWAVIRVLRNITVDEVASAANVSKATAQKYVRQLEKAGYFKRTKKPVVGQVGGCIHYRLIRDTGPEPPIAWLKGGCYDPNVRQVFGVELTDDDRRKVVERGVFYGGTEYTAPELTTRNGETVLVRPDPSDGSRLLVFDEDENLLCVAVDRKRRQGFDAQAANAKAAQLRKKTFGVERVRRSTRNVTS